MNRSQPERGYKGAYLTGFLIFAVVALRMLIFYQPDVLRPLSLLTLFGLLYGLEPWLSSHAGRYRGIYFALQAGVVMALSGLRPFTDFSTVLYVPLCIQALLALSRRGAAAWLSVYAALCGATLLLSMNWAEGLALFLLDLAVGFFFVSYHFLYSRMRADQAESHRLLAELQSAHQQLQLQAAESQELVAARERNRLARELHDSVSQAIFSIRLTSGSARLLLEREPGRVPEQVDRLTAMTADALAQLRSLIAELRPPRDS